MSDVPPDLNAILDRVEGSDAPAAAEPATPPAPEAPAPAATPEATETDPYDTGADTFDRTYVEKLRKESQRYRESYKPYRDVFDGYDEGDRQFLLDTINEIKSNPAGARERVQQILAVLEGDETPTDPGDDTPDYSSPDKIAALVQQQVAQSLAERERESQVNNVFAEARGLGYQDRSPEMVLLLHHAAETGLSVKEAHDALTALKESERQKYIDEFVASQSRNADNTPATVAPAGAAPSGERQINSLDDAKAGMAEFLKNALKG